MNYSWTMGTFDGLHRGHQRLIRELIRQASRSGWESLLFLFYLPPRIFFHADSIPQLISLPEERIRLLKDLGVDRVHTIRFGEKLSQMEPETFFSCYLRNRFRVQAIVVGRNFAFGKNRRGNPSFLKMLCRKENIRLTLLPLTRRKEQPVSSTHIRRLLLDGRVEEAAGFLDRPYAIQGSVIRGYGWGRQIGVPTANLQVHPWKILPPGVFVTGIRLGKKTYGGLCHIGSRPTLGKNEPTVEAHLLHFNGSIYGRSLEVRFLKRLRTEHSFPELSVLKRQIRADIASAARFLDLHPGNR